MNDQSRIDRLTDENLEQVMGGMSCNAAIAAAKVYSAIGSIFAASGDLVMGANFIGRAQGVLVGACPH